MDVQGGRAQSHWSWTEPCGVLYEALWRRVQSMWWLLVVVCLVPYAQVAESLVQIALKRHTTDNTSVVVVDLKGTDYWGKAKGQQTGGLFGWLKK